MSSVSPTTAALSTDVSGAIDAAESIATDLAPASAIALLEKADTADDALDAALKPIAAGVSGADDDEGQSPVDVPGRLPVARGTRPRSRSSAGSRTDRGVERAPDL